MILTVETLRMGIMLLLSFIVYQVARHAAARRLRAPLVLVWRPWTGPVIEGKADRLEMARVALIGAAVQYIFWIAIPAIEPLTLTLEHWQVGAMLLILVHAAHFYSLGRKDIPNN